DSARAVGAPAYAVGEHVVFGARQYVPQSPLGWPLIAHELEHVAAHPTTLAASAAPVLRAPSSLAGIPEKERLTVKVSTAPVTVPPEELKDVFATTGDRTSYDPGGETVFGTGIDKKLQRGLKSVGGYLTGLTNVLPINTTLNVALDLRPYGAADSIYR